MHLKRFAANSGRFAAPANRKARFDVRPFGGDRTQFNAVTTAYSEANLRGDPPTNNRSQMTESATEMRAALEDIDQQLSVIDERTESGSDTNVLAHAVHNLVRIVDNIVISLDR